MWVIDCDPHRRRAMTKSLLIASPLAGWGLPLAEVPDPVFAERMAGDGARDRSHAAACCTRRATARVSP